MNGLTLIYCACLGISSYVLYCVANTTVSCWTVLKTDDRLVGLLLLVSLFGCIVWVSWHVMMGGAP